MDGKMREFVSKSLPSSFISLINADFESTPVAETPKNMPPESAAKCKFKTFLSKIMSC